MRNGLISAQRFEKGAHSFAQRWEACSSAEQLWTWVASDNKLVGHVSYHPCIWRCVSCGMLHHQF